MTITKEFFNFFSKIYEKYYSIEELQELLLVPYNQGDKNIIHYCTTFCNDNIDLMGFLRRVHGNQTQIMRQLLSERTYEGYSALSLASSSSKEMFQEFKSLAIEIFKPDEISNLHRKEDDRFLPYEFDENEIQTCKYSAELPDTVEKFTSVFAETGFDKIIASWTQSSLKRITQLDNLIDINDIKKISQALTPESAKQIGRIMSAMGIEKVAALSPKTMSHFISVLARIDLNEAINKFDEKLAEHFVNVDDLDGFMNNLTPELINELLVK